MSGRRPAGDTAAGRRWRGLGRRLGPAVLLAGCATPGPPAVLQVDALASPAPAASMYPRLSTGADGRLYLSWLHQTGGQHHALQFSRFDAGAAGPPRTVASGTDWFVNWADFPSVTAAGDGTLAAHWLQRSGTNTYSYGIRVACSQDGGASFGAPFWLHRDRQAVEHGFATLVGAGDHFDAVWLDGRDLPRTGKMTLRTTSFGPRGPGLTEPVLDPMVCECCATDAARVGGDLLAVYRERTPAEVRDIARVRRTGGTWAAPAMVHDDGWTRPG